MLFILTSLDAAYHEKCQMEEWHERAKFHSRDRCALYGWFNAGIAATLFFENILEINFVKIFS